MKAKIGMSGPPYKEYWTDTSELTTHPQTFVGAFTMESADDASAEFAFFFGGGLAGETVAPYTVCLDDIHLDDRSSRGRRHRRRMKRRSPTCSSIRPAT